MWPYGASGKTLRMTGIWRATSLIVAALALCSCAQPPLPLDVIARDGGVVFTAERRWRYYVVPHRPPLRLSRIEVWTGNRWTWRVRAEAGRSFALPVRYGEVPTGARQLTAPQPLSLGLTYRFYVEGEASRSYGNAVLNSFVFSNGRLEAKALPYTPDPELQAGLLAEQARINELVATGLSRDRATRALIEEQRLASPYP